MAERPSSAACVQSRTYLTRAKACKVLVQSLFTTTIVTTTKQHVNANTCN